MPDPRNSGRPRRPLFAFRWVLLGIAIAVAARIVVAQVYLVPTSSMAPTLQAADRVLVDKVTSLWRAPRHGDIVVFDGTDVWTPATNGLLIAKRVIGLPGDRVVCCDAKGRVVRNGIPLDEPYAHGRSSHTYDVTVPPDRLWVLGDNRAHSVDSAANIGTSAGGSVPVSHVTGRAVAVVWPPARAGILSLPTAKESHDAA